MTYTTACTTVQAAIEAKYIFYIFVHRYPALTQRTP